MRDWVVVAAIAVSSGGACSFDPTGVATGDPGDAAGDGFRKRITIEGSRVTATLTDFPVLVWLAADADLANSAAADGADIVFTEEDGVTRLSHEIEKYVPETGELVAWVKVPTLSPAVDTVLFMRYGREPAAGGQRAADVWSNGYVGVWHLDELRDSTSHANHANEIGSAGTTPGRIGRGRSFGMMEKLLVPTQPSLKFGEGQDFTISVWVQTTQAQESNMWPFFLAKQSPPSPRLGWEFALHDQTNDPRWYFQVWDSGTRHWVYGASDIADGAWHHVVGGRTGNTIFAFQDGEPTGTREASPASLAVSRYLEVGDGDVFGHSHFAGSLDELRVSNVARSAAWIAAAYENQSSPQTFLRVGAQEP